MEASLRYLRAARFLLAVSIAAGTLTAILLRFDGIDCFDLMEVIALLALATAFSLALIWVFAETLRAAGLHAAAALAGGFALYFLIGAGGWALAGTDPNAIPIWLLAFLTEAEFFGTCE